MDNGFQYEIPQTAGPPDQYWHRDSRRWLWVWQSFTRRTTIHEPTMPRLFANFIGIAPQVEGPITRLNVRDNQFVKQGELLFEIDERPYRYALENALSEQSALEGQIEDEQRKNRSAGKRRFGCTSQYPGLASGHSPVGSGCRSGARRRGKRRAGRKPGQSGVDISNNNLHRIEPLLAKQFVTVDQVDRAQNIGGRSGRSAETGGIATGLLSQAGLKLALAQYEHSKAVLEESKAQHEQSINAVTTLEPLINQRGARASAVKTARYNLDNCRVYAPFDTRVTNLTISEGAYAHIGQQVFTLIDARTWWAIGNFREGTLQHIAPGMPADVYYCRNRTCVFRDRG